MGLSTQEIESLRAHLGGGNISVGAYPYTPDGFYEIFHTVIGPNLTTGAETTSTVAVSAGMATVTPASMTGISPNERIVVDVGDAAEKVVVFGVAPTTFRARFTVDHPAGFPIAVESGTTRVRELIHQADKAWSNLIADDVAASAGIQSLGKGEIVWFEGNRVLQGRLAAYKNVVRMMGRLVRMPPIWDDAGGGRLEAY